MVYTKTAGMPYDELSNSPPSSFALVSAIGRFICVSRMPMQPQAGRTQYDSFSDVVVEFSASGMIRE